LTGEIGVDAKLSRMRPASANPLVIDNETGEPVREDAE
jgi:hypothetical protein